jgi:hypothetical protein
VSIVSGDLVAVVFMDLGRWVARCPTPYCRGAEHHGIQPWWLGPPVIGGLGLESFACLQSCHRSYPAKWPDAELRDGVERLLSLRPDPANRNWLPGETLTDLLAENALHGIGIPALEPGGVLAVEGDRIVQGAHALTAAGPLPALGGG